MIDLFHGNVYKYGNNEIGMYLCDTNVKSMVCFIPIEDDDGSKNTIRISNLTKVLFLDKFIEIKRDTIISPLRVGGQQVKLPYTDFLKISEYVFDKLSKKIASKYISLSQSRHGVSTKHNYMLTEVYYKYLTWFDYKTTLQFQTSIKTNPGIMVGAVYWAELGRNLGSEFDKLRPVLILRKLVSKKNPDDSSYIVLPITSTASAGKYWANYKIQVDGEDNFVKIADMQRISVKRIKGYFRIGNNNSLFLTDSQMTDIKNLIKQFYV